MELVGTDSQSLTYGDATEGSRYASAGLRDDRANGEARLALNLAAHFNTPPVADPACQPPFEPYGDIGGCPLLFEFPTADTLATAASCETSRAVGPASWWSRGVHSGGTSLEDLGVQSQRPAAR